MRLLIATKNAHKTEEIQSILGGGWAVEDLTAAVWQRWPDHPPYEGEHDEPIPHLTVSETPIDVQLELPIACRAREVTLIEESEADGRWSVRRAFPFGQGVA